MPNAAPRTVGWPPAETLAAAWRQLVEDPDTAAGFAALVFAPLVGSLAGRNRRADADDLATAAGDAVLAFLKRPSAYDPARLPLPNYLLLIAKRRLLNRHEAERRHHAGRIAWDCVELGVAGRNDGEEEPLAIDGPELVAVQAQFTDGERRVFQLMRGGERRTQAFADALGVADDPDRAGHVKRAKDRVKARLRRAAGGDHE